MPDQIIREIPLIQRYARHNEADDFKFRTFLKVGLDLSNEELDAMVQEITDTVWAQIDCTKCAHCCSRFRWWLSNKDIQRLAKRLGMTPKQFSRKYVRLDERTQVFATRSPARSWVRTSAVPSTRTDRRHARTIPYLRARDCFAAVLSAMMIESTAVLPTSYSMSGRNSKSGFGVSPKVKSKEGALTQPPLLKTAPPPPNSGGEGEGAALLSYTRKRLSVSERGWGEVPRLRGALQSSLARAECDFTEKVSRKTEWPGNSARRCKDYYRGAGE